MALMLHHHALEQLRTAEGSAGEGDVSALRRELERLLQIYPDFSPALDRLAGLLEEAGESQSALRCRLRAVKAEPCNADLWAKLASLQYRRLGQTRAAIQSLKQVFAIDVAHGEAAALVADIERAASSHLG